MDKDTKQTLCILAVILAGTVVYSKWPETVIRHEGIPNIVTQRDEVIKYHNKQADEALDRRRAIERDDTKRYDQGQKDWFAR